MEKEKKRSSKEKCGKWKLKTNGVFRKDGMRLLLMALPFVAVVIAFSMCRCLAGFMLLLTTSQEFLYHSRLLWD